MSADDARAELEALLWRTERIKLWQVDEILAAADKYASVSASAAVKRTQRGPRPCGTEAAYARHRRHGEEPCAECKAAHAAETRRYKAPKVHLEGPGGCGRRGTLYTTDRAEVTCGRCTGWEWADHKPCGTPAAYRRHLRRDGAPVRCETCLQGERRRNEDYRRAA